MSAALAAHLVQFTGLVLLVLGVLLVAGIGPALIVAGGLLLAVGR